MMPSIIRFKKVFTVDGRLSPDVVDPGVMTGPVLDVDGETRNDADCYLVGMVFHLRIFEGALFTCNLKH